MRKHLQKLANMCENKRGNNARTACVENKLMGNWPREPLRLQHKSAERIRLPYKH